MMMLTLRSNMVNIDHGEHQDDEKKSDEEKKNLFRFDCVAEGNPAPSVFWTKEVR